LPWLARDDLLLSTAPARARAWLASNPHIGQTILAFGIKIAGAVLSFGFNLIIARVYGPVGVGAFGLMVTTLTLAATGCLIGLDYVLIRTLAGDLKEGALGLAKGAARRVAGLVCLNAIAMTAVIALVIAPLIARFTGDPASISVLHAVAWGVIPVAMIRIVSSALRGSGRIQLGQILDGPASTGVTLLAFGSWQLLGHPTVTDAGQLYAGAIGLAALAGAAVSWRDMRRWGKAGKAPLSPMLAGGWKILIIVLTGFATDWLILTSLARYASTAEVGLFRTAWQIAQLFNLLVVAFDAVAGPRIAAAWRIGDDRAIVQTARQSAMVMTLLSLPLLLLCLAVPEWLLHFFGLKFVAGATALRILALGQLVNMVTGPIGSVLVMTGHERLSMIFAIAAVVIAAALMPIVGPWLGLTGAALVSAGILSFRKLSGVVIMARIFRSRAAA
jgi:O-antigen/teichoic acid export membrane protein